MRNFARGVRFEHGDVVDGMDAAHRFRKGKGVGLGTGLGDDVVRTEILFGELRRGSSRLEELGLNVDFVAYLEVRRWCSACVGGTLISLLSLSDVVLEIFVEFLKIDSEFMGAGGGDTLFGMDGDIRMVTFVGKEGRDTGGGTRGVVVREFGERKEF